MYLAFVRRRQVEHLELRKTISVATMVAAIYANTNYDTEEGRNARQRLITEIVEAAEEQFQKNVRLVYGAQTVEEVEEVDWRDPLMAGMELPYNPITGEFYGDGKKRRVADVLAAADHVEQAARNG